MAGLITSGSFSKDLLPNINKWFGDYKDYDPIHPKFIEVLGSTRAFEEDVLASGLGLPLALAEGATVKYDDMEQGGYVRYSHAKYGLGFIVTREAVEDGQSDVIGKKKATALRRSMMQTIDILATNVLNNAFDTTGTYIGYDGLSLCNTAHTTRSGGTLSNRPTVDVDFSESALEDMYVGLATMTDDRGLKIPAKIRKIIAHPTLAPDIIRVLKSTQRVDTANNDISFVNSQGIVPEGLVENVFLTDLDSWYVLTDIQDGLKLFMRRDIELTDDSDMDTDNAKFKATMRLSTGFTDWRCIRGTSGA